MTTLTSGTSGTSSGAELTATALGSSGETRLEPSAELDIGEQRADGLIILRPQKS